MKKVKLVIDWSKYAEIEKDATKYARITVSSADEKFISRYTLAEKLNHIEDLIDDNEEFIFIAIEEMGELTQCLTKYLRCKKEDGTYDYDHLHEEFADVLVCMEHIKSIFGFDTYETRNRMSEKLDRAIERAIEREKGVENVDKITTYTYRGRA